MAEESGKNPKGDKYEQLRQVMIDNGLNPNDSYKPSTFGTGQAGALRMPNGNGAIGSSGSTLGQFDVTGNTRTGDYTQDSQGNWNLVKNSPTDIVRNYVTSSAMSREGLSLSDWFNAGSSALGSAFGIPMNADNAGEFAGKAVAGRLLGSTGRLTTPAPLRLIWAGGNFLQSLVDAQDAKNQAYLNQDFDYELAGGFSQDKDGNLIFKADYKKMGSAGPESGDAVKAAINSDEYGASMTADNQLNITVSPAFAASDRYKKALETIKEAYGNITVKEANEVVDKDSGKTLIQRIEDYIHSEQSQYLYNAQTIRDIKRKAPNASERSLNIAVDTSKIGYLSQDQLKEVKVAVYNDNNQLEEVNAKAYLDKISSMSKIERNDYMTKIGNRINASGVSDDEKAVLYAQSMALYAASDSNEDYRGMYQKDFFDEVGSTPALFSGIPLNKFFGGTELDTFRQHELSSGLLSIAHTGASIFALSKATNLIESGIRKLPGLSKVSNYVGESSKGALKSTVGAVAETGKSNIKAVAEYAAKSLGQVGFQATADAVYDLAKIIPYAATGEMDKYNFWDELATDFLMDVLVTYGPGSFVDSMQSPKAEYRNAFINTETGKVEYQRASDVKDNPKYLTPTVAYENKETGEIKYFGPGDEEINAKDANGNPVYEEVNMPTWSKESKLVSVTSNELAIRHAKRIDALTDSDAALKVQELLFDRNAAMSKLATQVRSLSDRYHFHKMLRYSADIRQVTADTLRDYMDKPEVEAHWENMRKVFKEVAPNAKDLSKEDQNYIKAFVNKERFIGKNKKDKEAVKKITNFYEEGLKAVGKERAAELDELIGAMKIVASDVFDFYVEKGLMTAKKAREIRAQEGYENGFLPMYMRSDRKSSTGGEVGQDRALYKKVKDARALIAIDDLDNPLNSLARYINNAMRAVAVNDRALAIREAASISGVGIHLVSDDGGAMKDIKSLKDFDEGFKKIYNGIVVNTKKSLPSEKEWQETNDKLVLRSNALKSANKVADLQKESRDLYNENRRIQRQIKKLEAEGHPRKNKAEIEKLFGKIVENRSLIADNKQQQLMFVDDIKRYTGNLMERARKAHKGSEVKLDIKSYLNVQATNELKEAITSENMVGQVQSILNRAVQAANPWVNPEVVIRRKAEAAAVQYRNKVAKEARAEAKNKKGITSDKINAAVDRATDKVLEKLTGDKKAEVTFIDDEGYATKLLDNYGDGHTIRYMLNGKEQRMVLDGQGSEELVREFYAPEFKTPKTAAGKIWNKLVRRSNEVAQVKRYLTTSADVTRVLPNIFRDWSRGIVTTGGKVLLSPEKFFEELVEDYNYTPEQVKIIQNGLMLARGAVDESTLTASLQMPSKNREKTMVRAMTAPDGDGFVRYVYDLKTGGPGKVLSALQDLGESFTRKRAMDISYYKEIAAQQAAGKSVEESIKYAVEAAYFAGRESTVNFRRRGTLIGNIAQSVPYLSQKFATLQSFAYSYIDDPIGVSRALKTTVSAYTSLIAIALSNEEARKKYFMLTEYDRSNNIIIPLDNGLIITLPLDDTIAAFLTPYRRMVESMNGLDPEAFYLCFAEALEALSPLDISGFSEGDKFNVVRGFEKLGAELLPTWLQPFIEAWRGRDLYYGTDISVDGEYTGSTTGIYDPTAGQMTTKSKNSKTLAAISDATGLPQWMLQNFYSEYGGNVGQYVLNIIDKIGGATEKQQGGKEWADSVFKPFTGLDSDQAKSSFYDMVNGLKQDKEEVQKKLKTLTARAKTSGAEEKAEILKERQKVISDYGIHVSDAVNNYMSAFEITGGLDKSLANQVWYLYKLYDDDENDKMYWDNSTGDYYTDKAKAWNTKQATSLAAGSGLDMFVQQPVNDYYDSYAEQAFKQTSYGDSYHYIADIEDIFADAKINRTEMFKNYSNMTSAQKKQWKSEWNRKVVKALAPYVQKVGVDNLLSDTKVASYLGNNVNGLIFVNDPWHAKDYLKKIFGGK